MGAAEHQNFAFMHPSGDDKTFDAIMRAAAQAGDAQAQAHFIAMQRYQMSVLHELMKTVMKQTSEWIERDAFLALPMHGGKMTRGRLRELIQEKVIRHKTEGQLQYINLISFGEWLEAGAQGGSTSQLNY